MRTRMQAFVSRRNKLLQRLPLFGYPLRWALQRLAFPPADDLAKVPVGPAGADLAAYELGEEPRHGQPPLGRALLHPPGDIVWYVQVKLRHIRTMHI